MTAVTSQVMTQVSSVMATADLDFDLLDVSFRGRSWCFRVAPLFVGVIKSKKKTCRNYGELNTMLVDDIICMSTKYLYVNVVYVY